MQDLHEIYEFISLQEAITRSDWPVDIRALNDWLQNFICQPNEQLGRQGAVCPHALPAIKQRRLLVTHLDLTTTGQFDKKRLVAIKLLEVGAKFKNTTSSEEFSLDCLIVTLSGLEKHEWRYVIDGTHRDIKPEILKNKLMVGGFHPLNNRPSRLNQNFFSMRSPLPLFAFRHMIPADYQTLSENQLYLSIYKQFYPDVSSLYDDRTIR